MKKLILIALLSHCSFAQDSGYLKFEAARPWVIQIDDTLITSENILMLQSGLYHLSARPQISYSWPTVLVEEDITISSGDTAVVHLSTDKSVTEAVMINRDLPKTTSYKDRDYYPDSQQYPKLKTSLLVTSIAANWLAFYFKRLADNNYTKYGRAAGLTDIRKYYDRAGNFDKASAVMLSISAAALSGYIYVVLTE